MSTEKDAEVSAKEPGQSVTHQSALTPKNSFEGILIIPNTESIGKLESAEAGASLSVSYRTKEEWATLKDLPQRCYYMGLKEVPNEDQETVLCAAFMGKGGVWIAGQMVLVDAVRTLAKGTPLQITFLGDKKNKSSKGNTNLFKVELLNIIA